MSEKIALVKKYKKFINVSDFNSGKYTFRLISNYIEKNSLDVKNILEIGCGMGFGSFLLALKYPDVKIYCLDNGLYRKLNFEIYSIKNRLKNLYFFDKGLEDFKTHIKFELIFTIDTIEHVHNPKNFFSNLLKLKNKDTHVLIHYPNSIFIDVHFMLPNTLFMNNKKIINFIFKKKINFIEKKYNAFGLFYSLNFINYFKMIKICRSFNVNFQFDKNINSFYFNNYLKNNKYKKIDKLIVKLIKRIDHRLNLFNLLIVN